ncbi:hypothetical protein AB1Y20_016060 [Prymnesium parvum]|uniref:Uncharacterized protein n=1 Tax=Prymnesium parvum TaxID=97485 RepID=A0AB34K207_PRYPA
MGGEAEEAREDAARAADAPPSSSEGAADLAGELPAQPSPVSPPDSSGVAHEPTSVEEPREEEVGSTRADSRGGVLHVGATVASWGVGAVRKMYHRGSRQEDAQLADAMTTRELCEHEADGAWTLVDVATGEGERRSTRRSAFEALSEWESARSADYKAVAEQYAQLFAMLQKQAAHGKEELAECHSFLCQRAAADAQYAQAISRHKLGGRQIVELGDLRKTAAAPEGTALPIVDAAGCEEVHAVRAVLGCMTVQCSEKLQRFAVDDTLLKEIAAAQLTFGQVCEAVCGSCSVLVDEIHKCNRSCVDAFQAYRSVFDESVKREAKVDTNEAAESGRDLWLAECFYRSDVSGFHEKLWQAGHSIRELLERFRVAEHKRVAAVHGALRIFVSLQQRLWADISASTTAVNAIFKDRIASTSLVDQPNTIALEALTAGKSNGEYISRLPPPASLLVIFEGPVQYQRSIVRTWANAYAVLTGDRFIHCFSCPSEGQHSSRVRSGQLLFSVRCARGGEPRDVSSKLRSGAIMGAGTEQQSYFFEVPTRVDGLLGKVGLSSGKASSTTFRTLGASALAAWLEAVRQASQ